MSDDKDFNPKRFVQTLDPEVTNKFELGRISNRKELKQAKRILKMKAEMESRELKRDVSSVKRFFSKEHLMFLAVDKALEWVQNWSQNKSVEINRKKARANAAIIQNEFADSDAINEVDIARIRANTPPAHGAVASKVADDIKEGQLKKETIVAIKEDAKAQERTNAAKAQQVAREIEKEQPITQNGIDIVSHAIPALRTFVGGMMSEFLANQVEGPKSESKTSNEKLDA